MQSEKARGEPSDGKRASRRKQAAQDWRCSQTTMLREVGIVRRRCDASMPSSVALSRTVRCGGVAEWLKAAVLKTVDARASVGSNPTASAIFSLIKPPDRWRIFHVKHSPRAQRRPYRPQASHRRPPHAAPPPHAEPSNLSDRCTDRRASTLPLTLRCGAGYCRSSFDRPSSTRASRSKGGCFT